MSEDTSSQNSTLALSTKVEEDFVAPLTAVRGSLEILRDHDDLTTEEHRRFVETALSACARLEKGVEHLAATVYSAGRRALADAPAEPSEQAAAVSGGRIRFVDESEVVEVDLSDFEFSNSRIVNSFYNTLEQSIAATGRRWYFLVNYRDCSIWPEAWVAFAHRAKKARVNYSLGTARYGEDDGSGTDSRKRTRAAADRDMFASRAEALAHLEELRRPRGGGV